MKYYVLCLHCGQPNEINSEYLTFCGQCGKKLPVNFRDWRKKNAGKYLEDYKISVGIPENELPLKNTGKSSGSDGVRHWVDISVTLGIVVGLIILALPSLLLTTDFSTLLKNDLPSTLVADLFWKEYELGEYGFYIESPYEMKKATVPISDQMGQFVQHAESFNATSPLNDFHLSVSIIEYSAQIPGVDLGQIMKSSAEAMRSSPSLKDFKYSETLISTTGIPGLIQKGTYTEGGQSFRFTNAAFNDGLVIWQVFIGFHTGQPNLEKTSIRVRKSIRILYDSAN
ncbi:MAG: hypothetical protein RIC15_01240 [Vicingaceae bacterium]